MSGCIDMTRLATMHAVGWTEVNTQKCDLTLQNKMQCENITEDRPVAFLKVETNKIQTFNKCILCIHLH